MTERFAGVLERYGMDITVCRGLSETAAKAFFQPVAEPDKAAPYAVTSLGDVDDRRWRCLTRTELHDGDTVFCGGTAYQVETVAAVYAGKELSHWWGILTKRREAAE